MQGPMPESGISTVDERITTPLDTSAPADPIAAQPPTADALNREELLRMPVEAKIIKILTPLLQGFDQANGLHRFAGPVEEALNTAVVDRLLPLPIEQYKLFILDSLPAMYNGSPDEGVGFTLVRGAYRDRVEHGGFGIAVIRQPKSSTGYHIGLYSF